MYNNKKLQKLKIINVIVVVFSHALVSFYHWKHLFPTVLRKKRYLVV
jgi:hypothetical protein